MNKNNLFSFVCLLALGVFSLPAQTRQAKKIGDFIESTSYNEHKRGTARTLQYYPEGDDFVCINGKNRFTRALYGSWSPFRLETSDRPVFAAYDKRNSKHIRFLLQGRGLSLALDSIEFCEARYTAGRRTYLLRDTAWGKGTITVSVLAFPDSDGAIWKFSARDLADDMILRCFISEIRAKKLSRNGDMGADPPGCFEAPEHPEMQKEYDLALTDEAYLVLENLDLKLVSTDEGRRLYGKAEEARKALASRIRFSTPDPYFNTLGGTLAVAADGIWDGEVWLHGAVGWRMPLSGWRAAYTGDALGWHDRARKHFDAYAASQVTNVPNTIPHPAQDSALHLARSVKKWGTPQYSNGYICRNPRRNNQMHHYDMNLCYIDELLWHFNWTGDLEYARQMWPVITRHLAWEKLNYDPDNDGLYDAYACIWASDALYYNSGAVTHSSAYNYRANKMAAEIAGKIGEDAEPYQKEADRILKAMNKRLWLADKGHWAEFQDFMGHKRLHESAGVWTIYHALDSETADPFQAYQATRYVDTQIPHIPVAGKGLKDEGYATISTTNWLPYSWSINNVAFAEVMHTALAYFQAGRADEGYKLLKSSVLDGMYLGDSPGNFGQISFYDAARGECYRDFGDPVGVASRVLIQGVYGILPDAMNGRLLIRPGFPSDWDKASLKTPDVSYSFLREKDTDTYQICQRFGKPLEIGLQVKAIREQVASVEVNGKKTVWSFVEAASGHPELLVKVPDVKNAEVIIRWKGKFLQTLAAEELEVDAGGQILLRAPQGVELCEVYDPQHLLVSTKVERNSYNTNIKKGEGHHTFFVRTRQGNMNWWQPVNVFIRSLPAAAREDFAGVDSSACRMVNMDQYLNDSVTSIFREQYFSPRSPYTTLQLPVQGIGEWCHPLLSASIDDSGLRNLVRNNRFDTSLGVPFRLMKKGNNIAFTSLWDNYPNSICIPLAGKASHAYLLLAGSTNHMQCHIANGVLKVRYSDGTSTEMTLTNPDNWCPIEQDFYVDGKAFVLSEPRPYRLHLKTGKVSRDLGKELGITGVYGREIEGGAGVLLDMPLDAEKTLESLTLETVANDVVIGLMGITLQQ
ncbi:DUF4450 domain-containing protein [Phocaeicola sp.]|uniref:DUF4450 domain-containing protein n=1 Tax=Phocaeicola sp. TaxID=2773926 RepID=UPI003AB8AB7A